MKPLAIIGVRDQLLLLCDMLTGILPDILVVWLIEAIQVDSAIENPGFEQSFMDREAVC